MVQLSKDYSISGSFSITLLTSSTCLLSSWRNCRPLYLLRRMVPRYSRKTNLSTKMRNKIGKITSLIRLSLRQASGSSTLFILQPLNAFLRKSDKAKKKTRKAREKNLQTLTFLTTNCFKQSSNILSEAKVSPSTGLSSFVSFLNRSISLSTFQICSNSSSMKSFRAASLRLIQVFLLTMKSWKSLRLQWMVFMI